MQPLVVYDKLVLVAYREAAWEPIDLDQPEERAEVLPLLLSVAVVPDAAPHLSVVSGRDLEIRCSVFRDHYSYPDQRVSGSLHSLHNRGVDMGEPHVPFLREGHYEDL